MNRFPYHRYLRYRVLEGDSFEDVCDNLEGLGFSTPDEEDYAFLVQTLVSGRLINDAWRERCDVTMFDETSPDMDLCIWIAEDEHVRDCLQRALFERVPVRHCATILTLKFGRTVTEKAVSLYRHGWWDTEELTVIDFMHYWQRGSSSKPDPPPVPLHLRPAASAWQNGVLPSEDELSTDDIVRTIQVDAFMAFAEARQTNTPASADEARKWALLAMRTSQIRKPKTAAKDKSQTALPGLKPLVYHPKNEAPSLADLEQPDDDDQDPI